MYVFSLVLRCQNKIVHLQTENSEHEGIRISCLQGRIADFYDQNWPSPNVIFNNLMADLSMEVHVRALQLFPT